MASSRRDVARFPSPEARADILERKRTSKMARSAHAYVRGATARFYEWLGEVDRGLVPDAPPVWICGDCHLGNLGPLADAEGRVRIRIRDLDQAVPGNPSHDLIRLGLSLSTAARGSDLPGVTTAHMLEEMIHGYRDALLGHDESLSEARAGKAVRAVLQRSTRRRWEHLAQERLERVEPTIPLGKRFWPLSDEERHGIAALVSSEAALALVGAFHGRGSHHAVTVLDAAYWMKGCSSLGTLRYAVLLRIGSGKARASHCLIDIKEAVASVAPVAPGCEALADHAERVVGGARALSPCLGDRMLPASLLGRPVVLRELMPQDLKLEIDQLTRDEAVQAARFLAAVVGHSHARQMSPDTRRDWADELRRHHTGGLDAPSWLWSTVVDLVARHERGYLDHCRDYALGRGRLMLRRHDLVRVAPADWAAAVADTPGFDALRPDARSLIGDWARRGWPAIVRRRAEGEAPGTLPLGVPLPPAFGKLRFALSLPGETPWSPVAGPALCAAAADAPPALAEMGEAICGLGRLVDVVPRPFGSLLWQAVTGLPYLRPGSDLDVLWPVTARTDLPVLLGALRRLDGTAIVSIDGELLFPDGAGVQWREFDRARSADGEVLAKTVDGLSLRRVGRLFDADVAATLAIEPMPHAISVWMPCS